MVLLLLLTDFVKSLARVWLMMPLALIGSCCYQAQLSVKKYDRSALLTFDRSFFWNCLSFKNIFHAPFTRWIDKINPGNIPFGVSRLMFLCTHLCALLDFKNSSSVLIYPVNQTKVTSPGLTWRSPNCRKLSHRELVFCSAVTYLCWLITGAFYQVCIMAAIQ